MVSEVASYESSGARKQQHPVIDCDIHEAFVSVRDLVPYLPEPWKTLIQNKAWNGFTQPFVYWGTGGGNRADSYPADGRPAGSDYELMRRQLLEEYNIYKAVLTGYFYPVMMGKMQVEFAAAAAAAYNDYEVEHWLQKDPRFIGSIHIAPQNPKAAAREIDRMAEHPQMRQVMLPIADVAYGEEYFQPIFEAANRHGLRIALHHTVYTKGALGMGQYYIERHMLLPQGMMAELYSMICAGIFARFPDLRIVCLEGGFTWVPHLLWRADREYKSLRQEVPWLFQTPSRYVLDQVRFSTQPTEDLTTDQWVKVIDLMGSDRLLMFSSDYPHFDFDNPYRAFPADLPTSFRQKILFENAAEFYGLDQ